MAAFAAVVIGKGDAARYEGNAAEDGKRGDGGGGIGFECCGGSGDFFGEYVFRHAGNGVVKQAAVFL